MGGKRFLEVPRFYSETTSLPIRVIADKSSVEIYLNGGETVLSSRMYPADTQVTLTGTEGKLYSLDGTEVPSDEL